VEFTSRFHSCAVVGGCLVAMSMRYHSFLLVFLEIAFHIMDPLFPDSLSEFRSEKMGCALDWS